MDKIEIRKQEKIRRYVQKKLKERSPLTRNEVRELCGIKPLKPHKFPIIEVPPELWGIVEFVKKHNAQTIHYF